MRTTLTIDDDVASLVEKENRSASEPMKQTINRLLRAGLASVSKPQRQKRFVVKPLDTGLTREQWERWGDRSIEDILEEAERSELP